MRQEKKTKIHLNTPKYKNIKKTTTKQLDNLTSLNNINIIAYNISWESMTGKKPEWALCSNNTNLRHPRHNSICVRNIATVLENNPANFILLQEAENYNDLIKQAPCLAKMNYEQHESGKDKMITFWNTKYEPLKIIRDEFENGRPWMAILYTNGWCIVNVHFGHYSREQEIYKLKQLIELTINIFRNE